MGKPVQPRALVFEDDEGVGAMLSSALRGRGYEVYLFADPQLCPLSESNLCYTACADVLISDLSMRAVSGLEFVENQARKGCKIRNVALLSASWPNDDREHAERLGCRTFPKPVHLREIYAWLDECERGISPDRMLADVPGALRTQAGPKIR